MRGPFTPVQPQPMTAEEWAAIHGRGRLIRRRFRLRLLGVRPAGWIALGLLAALWTIAVML